MASRLPQDLKDPVSTQDSGQDLPIPPGNIKERKSADEKPNAFIQCPYCGKPVPHFKPLQQEKPRNIQAFVESYVWSYAKWGGLGGFISGGLVSTGILKTLKSRGYRIGIGPILIVAGIMTSAVLLGGVLGAGLGWKKGISIVVKEAIDPTAAE